MRPLRAAVELGGFCVMVRPLIVSAIRPL